MATTEHEPGPEEVIGYFDQFSNWGRWGAEDKLGALNHVSPEKVRKAAGLVQEGITVSCARVIEFAPKPSAAEALIPPVHFMQASGETADDQGSGSAVDWAGLPLHGFYVTHLDAHSHIFWKGKMYNGQPASAVRTDRGATAGGVDLVRNGICSRGVLLDIPAIQSGVPLSGNEGVTAEQLTAAEDAENVRVEAGDVVLVRTGYGVTRASRAPSSTRPEQPGVATSCLPWLYDRAPAVLGTDTATDPTGAQAGPVSAPVHSVCLVAMGMWIIDGCDLEALASTCAELGRWEFLFFAAPLRLKNSTGSPMNPIAVF